MPMTFSAKQDRGWNLPIRAVTVVLMLLAVTASAVAGETGADKAFSDDVCRGAYTKTDKGTKIINGWHAHAKYWPGFAALRFHNPDAKQAAYVCGGMMISKHWLLTAAHCLWQPSTGNVEVSALSRNLEPRYGSYGLTGTGRLEVVVGADDLEKVGTDGNVFEVDDVKIYSAYRAGLSGIDEERCKPGGCSALIGNDIALVKIKGEYLGALGRISMNPDDDPENGRCNRLMIAGFGQTSETPDENLALNRSASPAFLSASPKLMETSVPAISSEVCQSKFKDYNYEIRKDQLCAGGDKQARTDSCQGDSGGPLVAFDRNGCPYQVGITSWGIGCAKPDSAGVYTRVSKFKTWIETTVGAGEVKGLNTEDRFDPGIRTSIQQTLGTWPKSSDLELKICRSGATLECKGTPGDTLTAGDKLLAMKLNSGGSGNLVIFLVYATGQVEQLFPRNAGSTLDQHKIRNNQPYIVPRPGSGNQTGFPLHCEVDKATLVAVRLPANTGSADIAEAEKQIETTGLNGPGGQWRAKDGKLYIEAMAHAIEAAKSEAGVAKLTLSVPE